MVTAHFEEIRSLRREAQFAEAIQKADAILSELSPSAHQKRAELLIEKTQCYRYQRNYEAAEQSAQKAIQAAIQSPPALKEHGRALTELGIILFFGILRNKEAEQAIKEAKKIFSEIKDNNGLAYALSYLGALHYFLGEIDKADRFSKQGLQLIDALEEINEIVEVKIIRAIVCVVLTGDRSRAEALLEESLALCEPLTYRGNSAWALYNLGVVHFFQGEHSKAETLYRQSLGIMLEDDAQVGVRLTVTPYLLILALLAQNSLEPAEAELKKYGELVAKAHFPNVKTLARGYYHLSFGQFKLLKHDLGSALEHGLKAKQAAAEINYLSGQIEVLQFLIQAHLRLYLSTRQEDTKEKVQEFLEEIEELSKQESYRHRHIKAIIVRGFLKRADFDLTGANEEFQLAETLAEKHGFDELAKQAHDEATHLRGQTTTLQRLMTRSPDQYEQMQMQDLLSYLEGARRAIGKEED
ncbi:MAG: tetratricopeptide repeat protein [Candidatus Heimdallarchaeota archaeon]